MRKISGVMTACTLAAILGGVALTAPPVEAKKKTPLTAEEMAQAEWQKRRASYLKGAPKDRALGAREHPNLLQEFGGVYKDDKVTGYMATIGGKMVANSEVPEEPFTFTLLNSSVVNAFALPGGYVYMSRQLLGLMNDEAEFASVLGHETGHVTDRHTDKRGDKARNVGLGSFGLVILGAVLGSDALGQLGQIASQQGQLYVLSYSRKQELTSDALGLRYMTKAGYDPYGAADMLRSLGAQTSLDAKILGRDAEKVPTWARTHPLTSERVSRATSLAQSTGLAVGARPRNQDQFLNTIDGMTMDDDAEQGFIRSKTFSHPKLLLRFTVPDGYVMDNGSQAVQIIGPSNVGGLFSGGALAQNESLDAYLAKVWAGIAGKEAQALPAARRTTINGMTTAITGIRVAQKNGAQIDVTLAAYQFSPTNAYHFAFLAPAEMSGQVNSSFDRIINSFQRISQAEAAQLKERRISVVTVKGGDSAQTLAQRMAYDEYKLERFLILNALASPEALRTGQRVKLITYRP
jgi:predicted Zn-dependent protease